MASVSESAAALQPGSLGARLNAWLCGVLGYIVLAAAIAGAASLLTWSIDDPSFTHATSGPTRNVFGPIGAIFSDLVLQLLGLSGVFIILPPVFWALEMIGKGRLDKPRPKLMIAPVAVLLLACAASALPKVAGWPLPYGLGGLLGDLALRTVTSVLAMIRPERAAAAAGFFCFAGGMMLLLTCLGLSQRDLQLIFVRPRGSPGMRLVSRAWRRLGEMSERAAETIRREPTLHIPSAPHPAMPVYHPMPGPVFGPAFPQEHVVAPPRPHFSDPGPATFAAPGDDDIEREELRRIASICAPRTAARPAVAPRDEPAALPIQRPQPAGLMADPIRSAMDVMAAPDASGWRAHRPSPAAAPPCDPTPHRVPRSNPAPAPQVPEISSPTQSWRQRSAPGGDDLYGRAVAIVLGDRRASADYLQQRLAIGYMRAADLIERMEREGILGAPVYNGMRPILIGGPGSREI